MVDLTLKAIAELAKDEFGENAGIVVSANDVLLLIDQLEAAKKDAARYQWLKSRNFPEVFEVQFGNPGEAWRVTSVDTEWEDQIGEGDTPDSAIDAAMQSTN